MKVLDLFAGLGGWSAPARERGHEVFAVDLDPRFQVELHADVLELTPDDLPWRPDLVLASPPCEAFSTLSFGHHWAWGREPKTEHARTSIALVAATRRLIEALDPAFWIIENPRAMLRKLPAIGGLERRTVTYCAFGEPFQKPTDLFGGFPPSLVLPKPCRAGDPCHTPAPRGSQTGIQGASVRRPGTDGHGSPDRAGRLRDQKARTREHYGVSGQATLAALRAVIPRGLAVAVLDAAERDLAAGRPYVPEPSLFG